MNRKSDWVVDSKKSSKGSGFPHHIPSEIPNNFKVAL